MQSLKKIFKNKARNPTHFLHVHIHDCMFSLFNQYMIFSSKTPAFDTSSDIDIDGVTSCETSKPCRRVDVFKIT